MLYAIGKPGERAFWMESVQPPSGQQVPSETVVIEHDGDKFRARISTDGATVIPDEPELGEVKEQRWSDAKKFRNARQEGGCPTPFGHVDSNAVSQLAITGAVTVALLSERAHAAWQIEHDAWQERETARGHPDDADPEPVAPPPFSVAWTLADNSVVTLNGIQMMQLGAIVGSFWDDCQQAGTAVRAAIDAATSTSTLAAIDITSGYPPSQ